MIKRIIFYSVFLFVYHLFLLALPLNIFLVGLKIPLVIQVFPWLFYPFLIFSPVLSILLATYSTPSGYQTFNWIIPVTVSFIGYLPLIGCYFFISALNSIRDFSLLLFFPIIIGLLAFWGSRILAATQSGKSTNQIP